MSYARATLLLLGALMAAGCASRSVREPPSPLFDFLPRANVESVWTADIGSSAGRHLMLRPALSDGVVYAADARGQVSAYRADTGRRVWEVELSVPVGGAVGVGEGMVLIGTRRGALIALDAANGKELWREAVSSEVLAPATASRGVVAVQTVDGKLAGLSAKDGKRLWLYDRAEPALSLRGTSAPIIVDDVVLTGFASGRLVGVQLQDGRVLWELPVSQPRGRNEIERLVDVDATPIVRGEMLYAASYRGKLVAVNLRAGSVAWSRDISSFSNLALDDKNIYVTDDVGQVHAFDLRTGASGWRQEKLRGRGVSGPMYVDGRLVVGDAEGYVHYLAPDDGSLLARYRVGGGPVRAGIVDGDLLYVSASDTLAALRAVSR